MAPTEKILSILCLILIVPSFVYMLVAQLWNQPLKNGPSFFLGVEVAPGFYAGPGSRWLARYHAMLVTIYLVIFGALTAVLAAGRWNWVPAWSGGTALFFCGSMWAFILWARRKLGSNPPILQAAVSLETRRLRDYIPWPAEALMAAITASSWALLLINGDAKTRWNGPVVMTYVILGLLPFKIGIVRHSFPVPAERPEEHYQWMEAQRRFWLFRIDTFRWFFLVVLGGYGLLHGWPVVSASPRLHWLLISFELAMGVFMMVTISRGQRRLAAMGRTLRPVGSWSTPFRPASMMLPGFTPWSALWCGGLLLLLIILRR